jgi:hypothetical protein
MPVSDLMADPRQRREKRTFRNGHVVGPPVRDADLDDWQRRWARYPLPADLRALLLRANGIHLWADTGRAYQGLAPLEEWMLARVATWGVEAKPSALSDRYLALTYDIDGAAFAVLESWRYSSWTPQVRTSRARSARRSRGRSTGFRRAVSRSLKLGANELHRLRP